MKYDPRKFEAFVYYHLTHKMKYPICDYHRELMAALANPRIAIAAPRGHSKSTWCSVFYSLFMCLENPGIKILIVSAGMKLAESLVLEIRKELESNATLKEFYGDQDGSGGTKWTNDALHLPNGSIIMAKGSGMYVRGFRPDIIIGDDLEDDEMVVSMDQRKKFDNWFWASLMGMLIGDSNQCVVVGTVLHPESFLAELLKDPKGLWKTRFYQAIKPDGTSLWEDMHPIETLLQIKAERGEYVFAQEYMNDPIPDDLRKFKASYFQNLDTIPQNLAYFTTVDPAIQTGNANDFTAIVTCGVDSNENIYVADIINKRMLPNETIEAIFNVYKRFNPQVIGIETQGFQLMLKYELDKQKRERNLYPIIRDLKHGGRRKGLRIEALQPLYENGKIYHCGSKDKMQDLETQLLRFPSPRCHDDIIDALAYQLDILRAGPKTAVHVNPESFAARLERSRSKNKITGNWGNHKLRTSVW